MKKRAGVLGIVALMVLALAATAASDETFNSQLFRPSIFGGNFVAIEDSHTLCPLGFGGALYFDYAHRPFIYFLDDKPEYDIVEDLVTTHIIGAFGPFGFLSIGAELPIHLYANNRAIEDIAEGKGAEDLESETLLGDVRAEIKLRILQHKKHWLGLALAPYATFPTGDSQSFVGEGRVTGGGTLILEHDFRVFNIALNGGYQYRGTSDIFTAEVGDAWKWGAGISRAFKSGLSLSLEYFGSWIDSSDTDIFHNIPMEVVGTLRYQFGKRGPRVIGGGGAGVSHGAGAPAYRAIAGVDYYYCRPKPTRGRLLISVVDQSGKPIDAKLIIKDVGRKRKLADTTKDGKWRAKIEAGDYEITATREGYRSASASARIRVKETTAVKLKLVEIPTILTVVVTDKITGKRLGCELVFDMGTEKEKKVYNPTGMFSQKWASGSYRLTVVAKGYETVSQNIRVVKHRENTVKFALRRKIEKKGKILFDFDSDVIRPESYPVLDDVVEKIKLLGKFKKIIIEGHCSSEGTEEYNMDLSRRRALAVKEYLVKKGIDPNKLEIQAYGESRPIASNETEEGRAQNRRVEFIIVEEEE